MNLHAESGVFLAQRVGGGKVQPALEHRTAAGKQCFLIGRAQPEAFGYIFADLFRRVSGQDSAEEDDLELVWHRSSKNGLSTSTLVADDTAS
ncbi:MAG: hypothetical protein IPO35_08020 [Uliginosibacterium sp.]|nr:hypothetical protein [Uliginosibacterium sp.]